MNTQDELMHYRDVPVGAIMKLFLCYPSGIAYIKLGDTSGTRVLMISTEHLILMVDKSSYWTPETKVYVVGELPDEVRKNLVYLFAHTDRLNCRNVV